MIITLTPFPSIEYIYHVEELMPNQITPAQNVSLNILSKGVYSAQIMKVLQEEPMIISSFGGFAGKSIKHYLDKSKIKSDIVWTEYETPHMVRVLMDKDLSDYTLQSAESFSADKEISKLNYKLNQHIKKISTLILSGSLTNGQSAACYGEWITLAKRHNIKVVISTGNKEVWQSILVERPYAIMLTEEQLKSLDFTCTTHEEIVSQMAPYLGGGIHYICVYLKNRGAIILSKNKHCLVQSSFHLLNAHNTASSGAFLGALAIGVNRQYEQEKLGKLCLAAALAADDNVMHKICNRKEIDYRYKKTKIKILSHLVQ